MQPNHDESEPNKANNSQGPTEDDDHGKGEDFTEPGNTDEERYLEEMHTLQNSIDKTSPGSVERLIMEMRMDMKKDTLLVIKKMESMSTSTQAATTEVKALKRSQKDFDSRLQTVQDTQEEEKKRLDNTNLSIEEVREQVCVLQGLFTEARADHRFN